MTLPPDVLCRIIGTLGGTLMSLATVLPRTWYGAAQRVVVSAVCGMFFADVVGEWWLGWSMIVPNRIIAASCIASFLGWSGTHAAIRITQSWTGQKA